jgi:hypothetical protein
MGYFTDIHTFYLSHTKCYDVVPGNEETYSLLGL